MVSATVKIILLKYLMQIDSRERRLYFIVFDRMLSNKRRKKRRRKSKLRVINLSEEF